MIKDKSKFIKKSTDQYEQSYFQHHIERHFKKWNKQKAIPGFGWLDVIA